MTYLYLGIAIIADVIATTSLKLSEGFSKPLPACFAVVGYGLSLFFLSLTLRTVPVGIAYAIWSGVGLVLITTAGWLFFQQKLDGFALAGMGLIAAGVIVINVFSRAAPH